MADSEDNKVLFRDINADTNEPEVTEIESFCVNCEDQVCIEIRICSRQMNEVPVSSEHYSCH